jgi:hypothetical protein
MAVGDECLSDQDDEASPKLLQNPRRDVIPHRITLRNAYLQRTTGKSPHVISHKPLETVDMGAVALGVIGY